MRKLLLPLASILFTLPVMGQVSVFTSTNSVTIDGTVAGSEWTDASAAISIDQFAVGGPASASDISGTVRLKWDATNIYALYEITDDLRSNDSADGNGIANSLDSFEDDSVEFFISNTQPWTNASGVLNGTSNFQYRINLGPNQELEATPLTTSGTGVSFGTSEPGPNANYVVELMVPWSTLAITPSIGNSFAFLAGLNDDDDGGTRDHELFWNTTDANAWNDASTWSEIQLAAAIPEPSTYAMIFGVVGLGAWFFIKRRRSATAA